MLLSPVVTSALKPAPAGAAQNEELEFYRAYEWCLNPYPTVAEAAAHLGDEVGRLAQVPTGWQTREVAANVYLLGCGLLNCVDEYLRGDALRIPKRLAVTAAGRAANHFVEAVSVSPLRRRPVRDWRKRWLPSFNDFLRLMIESEGGDGKSLAAAGRRLTVLLQTKFPAGLQALRLGTPIPFNRLCLTPDDYLALGNEFVRRFPDRARPILLLGLRTSGTYFVPLLRAFFQLQGYRNVELATIEPGKGPGRVEGAELRRLAARGYCALIVDDAPNTSRTLLGVFDRVRRIGFAADNVKLFVPTHAASPTWFKSLPDDTVITLTPSQWRKRQLLEPASAERRLAEYFHGEGFVGVAVVESTRADEFNAQLQSIASDDRGVRLKRVFEVRLEAPDGAKHSKYVLAKSVSWGWLGYHAFLMGHRLKGHVPRMLGLRDGILYTEWTPQSAASALDRNTLVDASADYIAARARHLRLDQSAVAMDLKKHNNGSRTLEMAFSRAYGFLPGRLMRPRLGRLVRERPCPFPTHIDGNMLSRDWIAGPDGPLKTDYEHHGFGRGVVNIVDPAYDLADSILNMELSAEEEQRLVDRYAAESGDSGVEQRLFMHKMLAGLWAMSQCQEQIFSAPRSAAVQRAYHRRFMNAWNFLTVHAARYCGSLCRPPFALQWRPPLVFLDIDGVLDRRLFGFPSATAAGIDALSLLAAHGCSVAFNSARSAAEVKEYCQAYSAAGGVAEHGSYLWDAVGQRERVLLSAEAMRQLEELRRHLEDIPGVFLDDRHRYSIRASIYREKAPGLIASQLNWARASTIGEGALAPLPTHMMHQLIVDLQLDRLAFHHTFADTAIVAKEVDKGTGLVALRDWVLGPEAETVAVGDDPADLTMFRVATRSFAPANTICRREAELFGAKISPYPFQRGLLDIVRKIIHPQGEACAQCGRAGTVAAKTNDLVLSVLQAADRTWGSKLRSALREPTAYKTVMH